MAPESREVHEDETGGVITVAYWAAARAAAGVATETYPVNGTTTLAEVLRRVRAAHPGPEMERVVGVCSALVGERPVGTRDASRVLIEPGERVELLPPFAGG